jgi:hypothetical protein
LRPKQKDEARLSAGFELWTRLQPIRTASEIPLEVVLFASKPFEFQRIEAEAVRMRRLGMSLRAIGAALGVDEKTVRKALGQGEGGSRR